MTDDQLGADESFDALLARVRAEALEADLDLMTYLKAEDYPQKVMHRLLKAEFGDLHKAKAKIDRTHKAKGNGGAEAKREGAPPIGEAKDAQVD